MKLQFKKWLTEGLWMNDGKGKPRKKTPAEERGIQRQPPPKDPYNATPEPSGAPSPAAPR